MISIKPHHFVDIITDFGRGIEDPAPHRYGHALHSVTKKILADRDVELRIDFGADEICLPCCHNINGLCDDTIDVSFRPQAPTAKREYNLLLDHRWAERLVLQEGDILSARDLCLRIRDRAGNINDIYREEPTDSTAKRQEKLQNGIAGFLHQD